MSLSVLSRENIMGPQIIKWLALGLFCFQGAAAEKADDPSSAVSEDNMPAFISRIFVARQLPPDAIVEGILTKSSEVFYLYRHPTRLERWERYISDKLNLSRLGGRDNAPEGHLWNWEAQQRARLMLWALIFSGSFLLVMVGIVARGIRCSREVWKAEEMAFVRTSVTRPASAAPVFSAALVHAPAPVQAAPARMEDTSADRAPTKADLTGSLSNIGLEAVLQVLASIGKTGILDIKDKQGQSCGQITLLEGKLMNVSAGNEKGVAAMVKILSMDSGYFRLRDLTSVERWRLRFHQEADLMSVLLDAHRALDESAARSISG